MATFTTAPHANGSARTAVDVHGPIGAKRRQPLRIAVGSLLILVCALLFALGLANAERRSPVLVVTHTVQTGQVITASDIGRVRVAPGGLALIPASQEASVIGKVASGRLVAGSPLVAGNLDTATAPDPNTVQLPMTLKVGMYPPDLAAGDPVLVVATPSATQQAAATSASSLSGSAAPVPGQVTSVVAQRSYGASDGVTATVSVPRADLAALASAAADGQVVLAKVGSGS